MFKNIQLSHQRVLNSRVIIKKKFLFRFVFFKNSLKVILYEGSFTLKIIFTDKIQKFKFVFITRGKVEIESIENIISVKDRIEIFHVLVLKIENVKVGGEI